MIFYAAFFLFFFQLLTAFVEATYAFGLLSTGVPVESAAILLFLSPALLLIAPKRMGRVFPFLIVIVALARVMYPLAETRIEMMLAGAGTASALLILPLRISHQSHEPKDVIESLAGGLLMAVAAAVFLRVLGSGEDISTSDITQLIAWLLAPALVLTAGRVSSSAQSERETSYLSVAVLGIGMMAGLTLLYSAFTAPNVVVRWTGESYIQVLSLLLAGLLGFAIIARSPGGLALVTPARAIVLSALFVASLVSTVFAHQIAFPSNPSAYPLFEPEPPFWSGISLALMLFLGPIIILDFSLLASRLAEMRPTLKALGGGFLIAAVFMAVMILAQIFTVTYDYIPGGEVFRDRFWIILLILGLALVLPLFKLQGDARIQGVGVSWIAAVTVVVLGIGTFIGAGMVQGDVAPVGSVASLRLVTYNIQQGYGEDGERDLERQLKVMRSLRPDLIGLQESDTNRVGGGNSDAVRFFADRLDMYSYYGPKTVVGTFGVAVLSRFPLEEVKTFYLPSEGEQTAAILAKVKAGEKTLNLLVTHLGNNGPIGQQQTILQVTTGLDDLVLMGDFNFRAGERQYDLTRQHLEDAFLVQEAAGPGGNAVPPQDRIDHVFLSPGLKVLEARYVFDSASDHPAALVEIEW